MNPLVPDREQRLSDLQTELERLRHVPGTGFSPAEERLSLLAEECAEIVRKWAATSERHAEAVSRFESHLREWSDAGTRLQQDATQRLQDLEQVVHQEWNELKHLHEEPVRQLAEHATSLTQVCIATASVAQQGFERSEARLAAIEGELTRRMTDLTRELHAVVAELRGGQTPRLGTGTAPAAPWPLEGVTRLHHQLRQGDDQTTAPAIQVPPVGSGDARPVAGLLPEAASALTERIESLERALSDREVSAREVERRSQRSTRWWRAAAAALAVIVIVSGILASRAVSEVRAAADKARQEQQAATEAAAQQVAVSRAEAARQISDARERADRAQIIGNVLAAPDLVRYNLAGRDTLEGASAQMIWSRSRGFVFSGSRLPPPPANAAYRVWLLMRGGAVSAAPFTPDQAGTATVAATGPELPRPVIGAMVTIEPAGAQSDIPSGRAVMVRPPAAQPATLIP